MNQTVVSPLGVTKKSIRDTIDYHLARNSTEMIQIRLECTFLPSIF